MSEELKPCPFCGCPNAHVYRNVSPCQWEVTCRRCNGQALAGSEEEVIEKWNIRIIDKPKFVRGFLPDPTYIKPLGGRKTLRDEFAMNALQGLAYDRLKGDFTSDELARSTYIIADAMMKEREK